MPTSLLILIALAAAYVAYRMMGRSDWKRLGSDWRVLTLAGGIILAAVFAITGRVALAATLVTILVGLWSQGILKPSGLAGARREGRSVMRGAAIELWLDHASARMGGRVLAGTYEGRDLDTLDPSALSRLRLEIAADGESRALLEAYLDRRMAGWRERMQADAGSRHRGASNPGTMSEEEAYQVLGLAKGAAEAEIRAAHRRLIKKMHPDSGGSTFLAARINEAKDRLLSKHR